MPHDDMTTGRDHLTICPECLHEVSATMRCDNCGADLPGGLSPGILIACCSLAIAGLAFAGWLVWRVVLLFR